MASIAIMIGGAVLNAAAFTGGNYVAKYLAGDDGHGRWEILGRLRWPRKHGMTKHLKLIRRRWQNIRANARSSLTGLKQTEKSKIRRSKTSRTPITRSSSTTRRTLTINCRCPKSRSSQTCINQVICRNRASFLSVVEHLRLDTLLFVSFKLFLQHK